MSLIIFATFLFAGNSLSDAERTEAIKQLEFSRQTVINATKDLTEAQWNFRPAAGRWTIAEIAEHIAVTEMAIPGLIQKQLMGAPQIERPNTERDATIRTRLLNRDGKAQAPEILRPTGKFPTGAAAVQAFLKQRGANMAFLQSTELDLRHHEYPHMALGPLDGYQWVLFLSGHTERHVEQMEEVKASPGYPR